MEKYGPARPERKNELKIFIYKIIDDVIANYVFINENYSFDR